MALEPNKSAFTISRQQNNVLSLICLHTNIQNLLNDIWKQLRPLTDEDYIKWLITDDDRYWW